MRNLCTCICFYVFFDVLLMMSVVHVLAVNITRHAMLVEKQVCLFDTTHSENL